MVTADFVDTSPASAADETALSDDTAPDETGGAEEVAAPVQEPEDYDFEALQTRLDAGEEPLTSAEKQALSRHHQSERDQEQAKALEENQRAENTRLASVEAERVMRLADIHIDQAFTIVNAEIEAANEEGRPISPTLLKNSIKDDTAAFVQNVEPYILARWDRTTEKAIVGMLGEEEGKKVLAGIPKPRNPQEYGQHHAALISAYGQAVATTQAKNSPDGKKLAALTTENTKLKAELEKLTGSRGKGTGASTDGKASSTSKLTRETYSKMSDSDREKAWRERPDEVRAL